RPILSYEVAGRGAGLPGRSAWKAPGQPSTKPLIPRRHPPSCPPRRQRKTASGSILPRRANPPEALQATLFARQGHEGALGFVLDDEPRPVGRVQRQADADGPAVVLQEAAPPAVAVRQRR